MKVVWICSVSNPKLREHLDLGTPVWYRLLRRVLGKKPKEEPGDTAIWTTNAIEEFEKIQDVELTVVFTHPSMRRKLQRFREGGIDFVAVNIGDTSLFKLIRRTFSSPAAEQNRVCKRIAGIVNEISPDVVHVMGAEIPLHSRSVLYLKEGLPVIVQLQTMLNEPEAITRYPHLQQQRECEYDVIRKAGYVATDISIFKDNVKDYISKDAKFLNISLLVAEKIDGSVCEKQYDFVYFAKDVGKSLDLALEAFAIAHAKRPDLSLDVVGGINDTEKPGLIRKIQEMGICGSVKLEGSLPTHQDVICQIRKARFALLPLKIDFVSSTVREAMSNGIPVVTTITSGTPALNQKRETVLLSQVGDHSAMAENILRLAGNPELAETLRSNGFLTVKELYPDNAKRAEEWVEAYKLCVNGE